MIWVDGLPDERRNVNELFHADTAALVFVRNLKQREEYLHHDDVVKGVTPAIIAVAIAAAAAATAHGRGLLQLPIGDDLVDYLPP
jgi:hypothetical protein